MSNKQKDSKWQKLKKEFYGTKTCVQSEYGTIDFGCRRKGLEIAKLEIALASLQKFTGI